MISELANALFITYVGTEYLLVSNGLSPSHRSSSLLQSTALKVLTLVVIVLNVVDRVTGAAQALNSLLQGFLHAPRILFAASAYTTALYYDCKRAAPLMTPKTFLPMVGRAFLRVLPLYPFLAVMISCVFMVLINFFEAFHLPLEYLNNPIYYGTLYGPFSFVYWKVKERVVDESYNSLPRTNVPW